MARSDQSLPPGRTSAMAVTSLVLGILAFCCSAITGLPAMVLGLVSLIVIGRSGGGLRGKGLAITGLLTGTAGTLIGVAVVVALGLLVKGEVDNAENLRKIGKAMHEYHDTTMTLPSQGGNRWNEPPRLSWRVAILPYLGEAQLYKEFKLDEPWDSEHNKKLLARMPKVYAHPTVDAGDPTLTYYQVFVTPAKKDRPGGSPYTALYEEGRPPVNLAGIPDGTSNTIMVAEAARPVPWTKPEDIPFEWDGPLPELGGRYPQFFLAVFADGDVRQVNKQAKPDSIKKLISPRDGSPIPGDVILNQKK